MKEKKDKNITQKGVLKAGNHKKTKKGGTTDLRKKKKEKDKQGKIKK